MSLAAVVTALAAAATELDAAAARAAPTRGAGTAAWQGPSARAAAQRERRLAADGRDLAARVRAVAVGLAGTHAGDGPGVAAVLAAGRGSAPAAGLPSPAALPSGPPSPAPDAVAAWWAGLDGPTRAALRAQRPELVGGLDGVPARDRDAANRSVLATECAGAEAEQASARQAMDRSRTPVDLVRAEVRLLAAHRRLARLTAVADAVGAPGRTLLDVEVDGGDVRAAVAEGDVGTARNVGVFTPGFTADVRDLSGRLDELEAVRARAGPDTAMVAWYGYDAPQWSGVADPRRSVLRPDAARVGAARLSRFLTGIETARPTPVHLTAIGHSYGSTTTAMAVRRTPGVDDAVYLGSPGLAGPVPGRGRSWVGESATDPIADSGWFGGDPGRAPGVVDLATGRARGPDGRELAASHGHEEYLSPGTTSAYDVAAVVAGRGAEVIRAPGDAAGARLRALAGG